MAKEAIINNDWCIDIHRYRDSALGSLSIVVLQNHCHIVFIKREKGRIMYNLYTTFCSILLLLKSVTTFRLVLCGDSAITDFYHLSPFSPDCKE